jgi:arylsulfatase I/J
VGYKTVHAGKWDLGFGRPQYLPVNRGFNSSFGFLTGAEDHFSQHICQDGLCLSEDPKGPYSDMWQQADPAYHLNNSGIFGDTVWTSSAIGAIHSLTEGQPLFLYLAFAAAHTPLQAPEESLKLFSESIYKDRRVYAAQMHALDSNVGRVVAALEEKQMWANSLVVFLSDNGGPLYWNNENISGIRWHGGAGSNNYPLRGGKLSVLEGGMRVPFVMAGGALSTRQSLDGQRNHALTSIADVFATFCVAAGVPVTHDSTSPLLPPVDGVDLMPLLTEENVTAVRTSLTLALGVSREVMGEEGTMSAIIEGDLKLVIGSTNFWFDTAPLWPDEDYPWVWGHDTVLHCGVEGCLFNLTADPGETTNIAATRPKDVSRLAILLSQDFMYEADPGPEEPHLFLAAMDARGGFIGPFAKDVQSQHDLQ